MDCGSDHGSLCKQEIWVFVTEKMGRRAGYVNPCLVLVTIQVLSFQGGLLKFMLTCILGGAHTRCNCCMEEGGRVPVV